MCHPDQMTQPLFARISLTRHARIKCRACGARYGAAFGPSACTGLAVAPPVLGGRNGDRDNTGGSMVIEGSLSASAVWRFHTVFDGGTFSDSGVSANFDVHRNYEWPIIRPRSGSPAMRRRSSPLSSGSADLPAAAGSGARSRYSVRLMRGRNFWRRA